MKHHVIQFEQVTKTFGSLVANSEVSFEVQPQTLHGIVGENGAGKSTIMNLLFGLFPRDCGRILVRGQEQNYLTPLDAMKDGIGMVHQHFKLVPTLSVWENITLGCEKKLSLNRWNKEHILSELEEIQNIYGFQVPLTKNIEALSVGLQQQVEILKLLYRNSEILIFDEPTAVLTPQETTRLFDQMRVLKEQGKTLLLITHKLNEILENTDRVTVMRQGKVIKTLRTKDFTKESLSEAIVGKKIPPLPSGKLAHDNTVAISVKGVSTLSSTSHSPLNNLWLDINKGEIVGVAGIEGNGQDELVQLLSGLMNPSQGHVLYYGQDLHSINAYQLRQKGLALIPLDRNKEGLVGEWSIEENLLLGHHKEQKILKKGFYQKKEIHQQAKKAIDDYQIRCSDSQHQVGKLSGGNQQKVIIARELKNQTRFILAAHPTRGVDIGAIDWIHKNILKQKEAGAAVILVSSELDELLTLSDRIIVLYEGEIQGTQKRQEFDSNQIGQWMTGAK